MLVSRGFYVRYKLKFLGSDDGDSVHPKLLVSFVRRVASERLVVWSGPPVCSSAYLPSPEKLK